jgi:hypothetical protein
MARFNQILVVSAFTLLTLAGCEGAQEASTPVTSPSPAATAVASPSKPAAVQGKYTELLTVVSNTKAAVESGNFAKAKTEFGKFEDAWKKVEDPIKAKYPKSYEAVEEGTDKVMAEVKKSKPTKDNALTQLNSLEKTINSIPKS